jgi:hypothetical protein
LSFSRCVPSLIGNFYLGVSAAAPISLAKYLASHYKHRKVIQNGQSFFYAEIISKNDGDDFSCG